MNCQKRAKSMIEQAIKVNKRLPNKFICTPTNSYHVCKKISTYAVIAKMRCKI